MFSKTFNFSNSDNPSKKSLVLLDEEGDAFQDAAEAQLHPDAHEDGGLTCHDPQLLERQRSAIVEVVKSLGKNLLTGNFDLLKISLPVKLFEPRSYLQKLADPWVFPRLLDAAAAAHDDPVLRMKYVVAFVVAGFHRVFLKWAKPFNPLLGETWQASLPNGASIFLEQMSHHPPISAFQLFGPGYYFHGLSEPAVAYKANAIKTSAKGYRRIEFSDGSAIDMTFPAYYIKGLLYSAPRADLGGVAEFTDVQNGLTTVLNFRKMEGAQSGSVLNRSDAVYGTMYRTKLHATVADSGGASGVSSVRSSANSTTTSAAAANNSTTTTTQKLHRSKSSTSGARGLFAKTLTSVRRTTSSTGLIEDSSLTGEARVPIAQCTGNWLSHVDWDGKRYWTLNEEEVAEWIPEGDPLPSDARFRADLAALAAGDDEEAQRQKEILENIQRADAKLRK